MNYLAEANTTEILRHIVRRLPDHLILKWKGVVTEIRERGQWPTLEHISGFLRRVVKAEFDPDFGDISRGYKPELKFNQERKKGIHSTQNYVPPRIVKCYICSEAHINDNCPTFTDSSISERIFCIKANRLCFSCPKRLVVRMDALGHTIR